MHIRELMLSYRETAGQRSAGQAVRVVTSPEAESVLRPFLEHQATEVFGMLCLNTQLELIGYHEVSRGDLSGAIVHPREVFKVAILANAASVVIGHNHPSGNPEPSPDDMVLTQRLGHAGDLIGVPLVDHVIIGRNGRYYSFQAAGILRRG